MKLQVFNRYNGQKSRTGGRAALPTISVYGSNGSISFSVLIAKELNITEGKYIFFAKDTDSKKDWYLCVSSKEDGLKVRTKQNGGHMKDVVTNSVSCRMVVDNILTDHKAKKNVTLLVSAKGKKINGETWYQILSRPLRIDGKSINE